MRISIKGYLLFGMNKNEFNEKSTEKIQKF